MLTWEHEESAFAQGYRSVCGIDEAGRGPLAGPVVAAAVILPAGLVIDGLDDSKKLTEKKREALYDVIVESAIAYAVAAVDEKTIDRINILEATFVAMRQAAEELTVPADFALVDGNRSKGLKIPSACVIGGDAKSPSIAAASILAKVTRDREMLRLSALYPEYGFEQHKAYGTKAHYASLDAYGPSPIHRQTFLKKYFAAKEQTK